MVIVTGGGTGIGEAICRKFAREGAMVVVNGMTLNPISDVVTAIIDDGGIAIPFAGDVSDEAHAKACVDAAIDEYGTLDVLSTTPACCSSAPDRQDAGRQVRRTHPLQYPDGVPHDEVRPALSA